MHRLSMHWFLCNTFQRLHERRPHLSQQNQYKSGTRPKSSRKDRCCDCERIGSPNNWFLCSASGNSYPMLSFYPLERDGIQLSHRYIVLNDRGIPSLEDNIPHNLYGFERNSMFLCTKSAPIRGLKDNHLSELIDIWIVTEMHSILQLMEIIPKILSKAQYLSWHWVMIWGTLRQIFSK